MVGVIRRVMESRAVFQYAELCSTLAADRRAVSALEYGLSAGVIVATIMFGFTLMAGDLSELFQTVGDKVTAG
jgi:Flp pilus assembly pilin Flp